MSSKQNLASSATKYSRFQNIVTTKHKKRAGHGLQLYSGDIVKRTRFEEKLFDIDSENYDHTSNANSQVSITNRNMDIDKNADTIKILKDSDLPGLSFNEPNLQIEQTLQNQKYNKTIVKLHKIIPKPANRLIKGFATKNIKKNLQKQVLDFQTEDHSNVENCRPTHKKSDFESSDNQNTNNFNVICKVKRPRNDVDKKCCNSFPKNIKHNYKKSWLTDDKEN